MNAQRGADGRQDGDQRLDHQFPNILLIHDVSCVFRFRFSAIKFRIRKVGIKQPLQAREAAEPLFARRKALTMATRIRPVKKRGGGPHQRGTP